MTNKKHVALKIVLYIFLAIVAVAIGFATFVSIKIAKYNKLPINLNALETTHPVFYSIDGTEIENSKTAFCDIDTISDTTKNAFISIEDKSFYTHNGYNLKRIVKATLDNAKSKNIVAGGSTITQQLAKNVYLNSNKTFDRKLQELVISRKIEKNYSKDQILESYLNKIYFGKNAYGLAAASQTYFNKNASELTTNESAFLAGLINSPTRLSGDQKAANERKNLVLSELLKDGKIDNEEYEKSVSQSIELNLANANFLAENYIAAAVKEVAKKLDLTEDEVYNSNIKIYTNLNLDKQKMLYNSVKSAVNDNYNYSAIIIDNKTNAVEAFISSASNAINIKRQPGSLIKPMLVYAPAIEQNEVNEYTLINNEKTDFNGYSPKNAGNVYSKNISVKNALSKSANVPAVKILSYTGIDYCKNIAGQFGLNFSENDNSLAIALGGLTNGENFVNLANAYTVFADNGKFKEANFVNKILDSNKNIIDFSGNEKKQIIGSDTAFIITDMLKEAAATGTAKKLSTLNGEVASKTGTAGVVGSTDNSDAYNVSYTQNTCVGVHIFEKNSLLSSNINGSSLPTDIAKTVLASLNLNENFDVPDTIEKVVVDIEELRNGHIILANEFMPERYTQEIYVAKRNMPTEYSSKFLTAEAPELNLNVTENSVVIEFSALPDAKTEIYRNGKLIKTVYNTSGKQIVIDDFVPNEKTIYTAKNIVKHPTTGREIESELSEEKVVFVENKTISENELNDLENYTEIFETEDEKKPQNAGFNLFKKLFKI